MADLEKVIKGLEICIRVKDNEKCPDECPYRKDICYGTVGLMADALSLLKEQEPRVMTKFGRWKHVHGGMSPGGTPTFACGNCGGSHHLHGAEYPRRKIICDNCGQINIYPWEKAYEEGSSLWPEPPKEET